MALVPVKTSTTTGYCDCICDCYTLASLRDEDSGRGYCALCAREHLDMNRGLPSLHTPAGKNIEDPKNAVDISMPATADPPGRPR
ncbi:MAG: hypothetical protein ACREQC_14400 [Candidatus Binataceae bacterium]